MNSDTAAAAPKLAMCNFIEDTRRLRDLALSQGFAGVDWSFHRESLPWTPQETTRWWDAMALLDPLEIRYHCPFPCLDLGHVDDGHTRDALAVFRRVIHLVARAGGAFVTLHIGLGRDTTSSLSWRKTVDHLHRLVDEGDHQGVTVCLENLVWGWASRPDLYEKLVRYSGAGITFDVGHAWSCESIQCRHFDLADFLTPHPRRVFNAHVYHREDEAGHHPPERITDIQARLDLLRQHHCQWWVLEHRDWIGLQQTKQVVDDYFALESVSDHANKNADAPRG